ncbi:hypothetical protein MMAD_35400 [Mycolicibacterium madagascariense]|uniref:Uncharacterized protein n=1 Tax=Mycolicibacterium madagascariense TaxID=212765 RepID=A0A7I7XJF7_9MYCO|nr:hypothetical protein [Mycolicibacterium madagascariense]MCV7013729.1 hypothetical protein [Mycolicibacterium madagascariense]BBZ29245.1 hypothetical protein MMAD_35400 [Mycolicibacterium madagascariense]
MGASLKVCRRRTACAVLASGMVVSLTALTGGVAPAFAKPGDDPSAPSTTVVPEPAAPREAPAATREAPTAADVPTVAPAPVSVPSAEPSEPASAPAPSAAQPSAVAPPPTRSAAPVAPTQDSPAPVTREAPPTTASTPPPVTSVTKSPTTASSPSPSQSSPSQSQSSPSPSSPSPSSPSPATSDAATPSSAAPRSPQAVTPSSSDSQQPPTSSGSADPSAPESTPSSPNSASTPSSSEAARSSGETSTTSADSATSSSGAGPTPRALQKIAPQTLQAPDEDVQIAKTAAVVEAKPDVAPKQDIDDVSRMIDVSDRDRDPFGRDGRNGNDRNNDNRNNDNRNNDNRNNDNVQLAGGWDRNVRQWRPDWVDYDEYYRPVLSNPYRDPVRIVYVYQNAPRVVLIPPLGRVVLEVAQYAAYSFTAVVSNAVNQAVNVAVGSFFGGGYFPGVGLPLPPPPPPLVNYANVPVQVRYPNATYQPFRVNKIVDVGPDPQYGEQKVLLDGVTPAWGEWRQTPSGERSFEVHKTQQFPGLDDPQPGPLPGDYQLTLASDEKPSGMNSRDVYMIAVAVACGALSIAAVILAVVMGRRRRSS